MSKGAQRVLAALKLLGSYRILEEYVIGERLRLDFYIKELRLAAECDGVQHDEVNAHFHKTRADFVNAKARDRRKEELCEAAGIVLVRLNYDEVMRSKSAEELRDIILARKEEASRKEEDGEEDPWA